MEVVVWLVAVMVGVFSGMIVGNCITYRRLRDRSMGRLRIDRSEPDEPTRMFVELRGVTPDMIAQHELVTFEVVAESYISPK